MPRSRKATAAGRALPSPPAPREFRQGRARASHQRILRAALELYAERGFHATQTPDIARRAGMSVGGLYRYFRDKRHVFLELVHHTLERNRREQERMLATLDARAASGGVDLRRVVEAAVDWTWSALHAAPAELLRTFAAMAYEDAAFAELNDRYDRYERELLARVLGKLTSRARIPSPLAAARLVDLVIPTVATWAALHPDQARGVKEATVDMIHRYLSEGGAPAPPARITTAP
ncbi:MAG: helix-turn-helix domain-containing protein [Thermodesulfobacteriota bacterium]